MLVALAAALDALFYLYHMPVALAFRLDSGEGLRFGAAAAAIDPAAALRRAVAAERKPLPRRRLPRRFLLGALRRLRMDRAVLSGSLGLPDAAATALVCGGAGALGRALAAGGTRVEITLRPDFGGATRIRAQGMIVARAGHIILAAASSGIDESIRRMRAWIDTPSRGS